MKSLTLPANQIITLIPALRRLIGLCVTVLPCLVGSTYAADRPSAVKVTTVAATATSGPVVKIGGRIGFTYTAYPDVADNTTFDLTGAYWASRPDHPTETAFVAGNQPAPPKDMRIIGGVVHGSIPLEWSWILTHAFSGTAFHTVASGMQILDGARIHNVEDGWRPRETPDFKPRGYPNNGHFIMRNCYLSGIRDDCIEDDEFMPGTIEDCLFDGAFTFFSEQNETINGIRYEEVPTIGPDEDSNIHVTRALVRLAVTNGGEPRPGTWFKLHNYQSRSHHIVITDSVFATDKQPDNAWKLLDFPKNSTFEGTNLLLWLGEPGAYGAHIPEGVTFIEGQAAKNRWYQLRNEWLVAHGYEPRSPEDWNPMEAPVAAPRRGGSAH